MIYKDKFNEAYLDIISQAKQAGPLQKPVEEINVIISNKFQNNQNLQKIQDQLSETNVDTLKNAIELIKNALKRFDFNQTQQKQEKKQTDQKDDQKQVQKQVQTTIENK